ncbi:MAG: hypothetical protein WCT04_04000 [Planctomycetota bacterium]
MYQELVVHVLPENGNWVVRMPEGKPQTFRRKGTAALFAKQAAASSLNGRVIFYYEDGRIELERVFINHRVVFDDTFDS